MKEIIRIGKLMFSQQSAVNLNLSLTDLLIVSFINDFIETGKCEKIENNNYNYYFLAYNKILTDLPILNIKKRQLLRTLENLKNKNIIIPLNKNVGRKKTYFRLNLSQVKNSKYIIDDDLFIINPSLSAPDVTFYCSWFVDWFNNLNNIDLNLEIKDKFLNLIKRVSSENFLKINNQNVGVNDFLKTLTHLFRGDNKVSINRIKELFYMVDCAKNIKNKFKYTLTVFYNEALSI